MSFFNYHGYKLEQQRIGEHIRGRTNVIYLHGFNDPFQNHLDILEVIASEQINLWAINFPGHGNSEEMQDISWERLVDILRFFIEERQLEDVVLFGYSMGGGVVLKAIEYQLPIKAGVMISPFCFAFKEGSKLDNTAKIVNSIRGLLTQMTPQHKLNRRKPRPWNASLTYLAEEYVRTLVDFDLQIANNETPLFVVLLEEDTVIPPEDVRKALNPLSKVKFKQLKGYSHNLYYLEDAKIAKLIDIVTKEINRYAQVQKSIWAKLFKK